MFSEQAVRAQKSNFCFLFCFRGGREFPNILGETKEMEGDTFKKLILSQRLRRRRRILHSSQDPAAVSLGRPLKARKDGGNAAVAVAKEAQQGCDVLAQCILLNK